MEKVVEKKHPNHHHKHHGILGYLVSKLKREEGKYVSHLRYNFLIDERIYLCVLFQTV